MAVGRVPKKAFYVGVVAAAIAAIDSHGVFAQPNTDLGPTGSESDGNLGPSLVGDEDSSSTTALICDPSGDSANYTEFLSSSDGSALATRTASTTTGCPNHVNWPMTPNDATENPSEVAFAAYPMLQADGGTTDLTSAAKPTGMMLNGVALYSAYGGKTAVEGYETTAFYIEGETLDPCGGHANSEGIYHYHNTPGCLQEHAMVVNNVTVNEHSPLIGWSYDGFPVYGQLGPAGVEMKVCDEDGADDTYCLDVCSGYEGSVDADDFLYRYYLSCGTHESFFPFTTNCYRGCCPVNMTCGGVLVESCGDDAEVGYTTEYVPIESEPLSSAYDTDILDGDDAEYIGTTGNILDCADYVGSESSAASSATPAPSSLEDANTDQESPAPRLQWPFWSRLLLLVWIGSFVTFSIVDGDSGNAVLLN